MDKAMLVVARHTNDKIEIITHHYRRCQNNRHWNLNRPSIMLTNIYALHT